MSRERIPVPQTEGSAVSSPSEDAGGPASEQERTGAASGGKPVRYEKLDTILRIALDMQSNALGLSFEDIQRNYSDKPLSRSTAERFRKAIERVFPQIEEVDVGEPRKHWRIPAGSLTRLADISADELADLATAADLLKRDNMPAQVQSVENVIAKVRAAMKPPTMTKIDTDLEVLTEAEGVAMRPGPHPKINVEIIETLRDAILKTRKVCIDYRYRGSGKEGFEIVRPYGFLYGNRHYLVAWSDNPRARSFRNYALSNIGRVMILNETFERKKDFSLKEYAAQSFGVFQEKPYDIVLRFSPDVADDVCEFVFHPTQRIEHQLDRSIVVRFRAGGLLEICWHLFTWGEHVKVMRPQQLRNMLRQEARACLKGWKVGT